MKRPKTTILQKLALESDEAEALPIIMELRRFRDLFEEIRDLIGDKRSLSTDERVTAKTLLTNLKSDLKIASKAGIPQGRTGEPSVLDRQYFQPAVSGACASLTVRLNTHPIRARWRHQLNQCLADIEFYHSQLESQFPNL